MFSLGSTINFYHSPQPLCSTGNLSRHREPMEPADPVPLSCASALYSFAECLCQNPARHVHRQSFFGEATGRGVRDRRDSHGSVVCCHHDLPSSPFQYRPQGGDCRVTYKYDIADIMFQDLLTHSISTWSFGSGTSRKPVALGYSKLDK